jgi:hypothetical protein
MKDDESHPEKESNEAFFKILLFELQKEETRSSSRLGTRPGHDGNPADWTGIPSGSGHEQGLDRSWLDLWSTSWGLVMASFACQETT